MICRVLITMLKVPWFVVLFIYTHFWSHLQSLTVYWLCCQPVILLPLCPGSLTHKNPQWCKVIHRMHPEGPEDWSIDLNMISHLYTFCGFYYGCGLPMHILAPCNIELWSLSSDKLSGYIKSQIFSISNSFFLLLALSGSGLRLMIFHKMSPRTHHNYL